MYKDGAAVGWWGRMAQRTFKIVLIKPSHYDDDGYVVQWWRTFIPSNSLASLYGVLDQCARDRVLGPDVDISIEAYDEVNTVIDARRLARRIRVAGAGFVGLVGVQTNQFPRSLDLARQFRADGLPVVIGGFHVSGCLAMLPDLPAELQQALDLGVSLFAGEAEGRMVELLQDIHHGRAKPVYNYLAELPSLAGAALPLLPRHVVDRVATRYSCFDAGRGCPFQCSFCTIINVQGRQSRRRTPDDVEAIVRANAARGVTRLFVTDDDFARNRDWEPILDRLIALRGEGISLKLTLQVDTQCHRIPRFIEKAARAGCHNVFIGLESINPESLKGAKKRQNKISEYRAMLQAWKRAKVLTWAGYIVGFPADTPETVARDIEIIKRELPVDLLEFFVLTPLPGSEDHKTLHLAGVAMDPDMNKYDTEQVTTAHPRMSAVEWERTYREAWARYYTDDHVETVLRRAAAAGLGTSKLVNMLTGFAGAVAIEGVHPLQSGFVRRKIRRQRRSGLPIEPPVVFHMRRLAELLGSQVAWLRLLRRYHRIRRRVIADPAASRYVDDALRPEPRDLTLRVASPPREEDRRRAATA